ARGCRVEVEASEDLPGRVDYEGGAVPLIARAQIRQFVGSRDQAPLLVAYLGVRHVPLGRALAEPDDILLQPGSPVPVLDGLVLQPTQAIPDPVVGLLLRQAQVINLLDGLRDGAGLLQARERREGRLPGSGHAA